MEVYLWRFINGSKWHFATIFWSKLTLKKQTGPPIPARTDFGPRCTRSSGGSLARAMSPKSHQFRNSKPSFSPKLFRTKTCIETMSLHAPPSPNHPFHYHLLIALLQSSSIQGTHLFFANKVLFETRMTSTMELHPSIKNKTHA